MNQQLSAKMPTAGLKLSLALMLALLIVPAYVVAPVLFAELTSAQAGLIAGKIFHVSNLAFLILCVAAALFARRLGVTKATWYLLLAVTLMVAINVFAVSTMMTMMFGFSAAIERRGSRVMVRRRRSMMANVEAVDFRG